MSPDYDAWFETIAALIDCHSPSGAEAENDRELSDRLRHLGREPLLDSAGNLIVRIPGRGPGSIAITAHKDEIGMLVKQVEADGRVQLRRLGGTYPWIYGEGVIDLLGDRQVVPGILSFGSRHISHESPQKAQQDSAPVRWEDVWVETRRSPEALEQAGIRPGSRAVVGRHRKAPIRLGDHIAGYTLDNKASLAILLELARRLEKPRCDVFLLASAKEEVGAVGAMYFSQRQRLDALVALEIIPLAPEYGINDGPEPVLLSQDGYGIYDEDLTRDLAEAAERAAVPIQRAIISGFGSDASIAMKFGHIPRGACLGFPTQNTHGYEIAHLGAIARCADILVSWLS